MCGISGWFDTSGERPPNKGLVKAMNDALIHRGPDGEGFHFAPGIGFGHRRLAIIDLATGEQPKFDESGMSASPSMARSSTTGNCARSCRTGNTGSSPLPTPK